MGGKREWLIERLTSVSLILAGLTGLGAEAASLLGWTDGERNREALILYILALLAIGIGLERYGLFHQYDQRLQRVDELLRRGLGGRHLEGQDEGYREAARLCTTADRTIRALIVGGPKAPPYFIETIARRLRELNRFGSGANFVVVLAIDPDQLPDNFVEQNDRRFGALERFKVRHLVHLYILELKPAVGMDVLLVDRKHVFVGFATSPSDVRSQDTVLFENEPQLASSLVDWFTGSIAKDAVPYQDWVKTRSSATG